MDDMWLSAALLAMMFAVFAGTAFAVEGKHPSRRSLKKGILLVAFGTTLPEARRAFECIREQAESAFPNVDTRWAFTSRFVRARLAQEGHLVDSPEMMLARMMDESFTHVAILSLHVIPGEEFHDLRKNAGLFARMTWGIERIEMAGPLLSSHEDMVRVGDAMMKTVPPSRKPEEAVLFIGHGSGRHPADAIYSAMNGIFQDMDPNVFVGTISGHPTMDETIPKLKTRNIRKAYLIPLMAVAGDHARKDMAGDGPGSWKSALIESGIACEPVLTGMAEHREVVEIWLDHLRDALRRL